MLLICHFALDPVEAENFVPRARRALGLLTAQSGCLGGELGRCPDDTTRWVLVARFESVVAYRRALSPFEVREQVIPLLSEALTVQPGGFEVLATAQGGAVADHATLLVADTELTTDTGTRPGDSYR
ncbi:MAG: antibiotic biosynthesis monooxygenase [Pseudonocardiaceae bacterium]